MSYQILITALYTGIALLAFAGNSILCRLALGAGEIDATSFTIVRLVSGVVTLAILVGISRGVKPLFTQGGWSAATMLFVYALAFSFAYITLDTGTGALVLFGSVQVAMIIYSIVEGKRLNLRELGGLVLAFSGLVVLVAPGVRAPPLVGFVLMVISGVAWAGYTLLGRASTEPLIDTAANFLRTLPFVLVLGFLLIQGYHYTSKGLILAAISGALASGLGYAIWYKALAGLSAVQAAVLMLLVPVIAALGGIVFVDELLSQRFIFSSVMVLGGVGLVILARSKA